LPKSPEEKTRPIISPKKELSIAEELQKGSEMLRKEATMNLQKFGGSFMPDFYGGKARMDFSSRNGYENQVGILSKMTVILHSLFRKECIIMKFNQNLSILWLLKSG
jgi:hypothetical protein